MTDRKVTLRKRKLFFQILPVLLAVCLMTGCGGTAAQGKTPSPARTASAVATVQNTPVSTSTPTRVGTIDLQGCTFGTADGTVKIWALCADYVVPENRADPEGRKISLRVVVIKATSRNPQPDPLFLLAGGPGQAATEAFAPLMGALERVQAKRDLVLVDQRGTGKSNPLQCELESATDATVNADVSVEDQIKLIEPCINDLKDKNDLTQYTTAVAMQDLDAVRQALGYKQINLLGVSYGTRAALVYLSLYPQAVRSVVLDGVAPLGWGLGVSSRADAQRAIDLIFQRCVGDAACNAQFPKLKSDFFDLLSSLQAHPVDVNAPDPTTGEMRKVHITPGLLSQTVRLMSYNDLEVALIPLMIHNATVGDYSTLVGQYLMLGGSLGGSISLGMYYSVWCAEDLPLLPKEGELGTYYLPNDMTAAREVCRRMPKVTQKPIPAPHDLQTPVLLISGQDDPVTPPANAEQVAKLLPNSLSVILPGLGHNNFYVGCMPALMRDFIEAGSPKGLDTSCTQEVHPMQFFLNPVGPKG